MIFSRIVYGAIGIGLLAGLLMSVMQVMAVDPIIFASETYEVAEPEADTAAAHDGHDHSHGHDHGHGHSHEGWGPEDGAERTFYTVLSNVSAAIGFAAVLLALMVQFWLPKHQGIKPWQSLLWGIAGFAAIYLAPGIGMPPEIPGISAAPIEQRQAWWLLAVACVAIGLGVLALSPVKFKAIGVVLITLPYLVGAPHHPGPAFEHPDPDAVTALTKLHQQFIISSGISNLLFWIVLGLACGFVLNRWLKPAVVGNEQLA